MTVSFLSDLRAQGYAGEVGLRVCDLAVWLVLRRVFGSGAGQVKVWERDINDN